MNGLFVVGGDWKALLYMKPIWRGGESKGSAAAVWHWNTSRVTSMSKDSGYVTVDVLIKYVYRHVYVAA